MANEPRFADVPPARIVPALADEGIDLARESSFAMRNTWKWPSTDVAVPNPENAGVTITAHLSDSGEKYVDARRRSHRST